VLGRPIIKITAISLGADVCALTSVVAAGAVLVPGLLEMPDQGRRRCIYGLNQGAGARRCAFNPSAAARVGPGWEPSARAPAGPVERVSAGGVPLSPRIRNPHRQGKNHGPPGLRAPPDPIPPCRSTEVTGPPPPISPQIWLMVLFDFLPIALGTSGGVNPD
jgi:hypothetical protein